MSIVLCMSLNEPSTFSNRAHSRPAPSFRRRTATFGVLLLIAVYKFVGAATCRRISALPTESSLMVRLILSAASSASARVVTIALAQASTARVAESFTNRRVVVGRNIFWVLGRLCRSGRCLFVAVPNTAGHQCCDRRVAHFDPCEPRSSDKPLPGKNLWPPTPSLGEAWARLWRI